MLQPPSRESVEMLRREANQGFAQLRRHFGYIADLPPLSITTILRRLKIGGVFLPAHAAARCQNLRHVVAGVPAVACEHTLQFEYAQLGMAQSALEVRVLHVFE